MSDSDDRRSSLADSDVTSQSEASVCGGIVPLETLVETPPEHEAAKRIVAAATDIAAGNLNVKVFMQVILHGECRKNFSEGIMGSYTFKYCRVTQETMKILLIENEEAIISILIEAIEERFGKEILDLKIETSSLSEAAEMIDYMQPDAVVLDLFEDATLPGAEQEGIEFAEKILALKSCLLIIFTGYAEMIEDIEHLAEHPFVEIVRKGADSENTVTELLSNWHLSIR